jgi:cobalt-zinc-cadmium efflux system outer membrane protein
MEPLPSIDPLLSPAYVAARADREAAAKRVRVEQTRAAPDVTVSLGVRRLNGADSASLAAAEAGVGRTATALVGGLSIPFPVFDRNKGNISAAEAELRAADARVNAALLDAEADTRSALSQTEAAEGRVAAALQGQQNADQAYYLTRLGYEGGKLALIEVNNARRALAEANIQLLNARIGRLAAEAALARLQGRIPFGDRP